jgi:hypothetical protein
VSWPVVAVVLLAAVAVGALAARLKAGAGAVVVAAGVAGWLLFSPATCANSEASGGAGAGSGFCDDVFGARLPQLGPENDAGHELAVATFLLTAGTAIAVRRRRSGRPLSAQHERIR